MTNLFFIHIEKAAGTSFHDLLRENIFPYHILEPVRFDKDLNYTAKKINPKVIRLLNRWLCIRHFGGHCIDLNSIKLSANGSHEVITLLREPMGRTLSHYFYQREVMGVDWTVREFIENKQFQNFMCRKLCGEPSANKVIDLLEHKKISIGVIEEMARTLSVFCNVSGNQWLNLPDKLPERNVRADRVSKADEVSSEDLEMIKLLNSEDFKLYRYVVSKIRERNNFNTTTNAFKKRELRSRFCFFCNKIYSIVVVRPVERLLRRRYPDVMA